MWEILIVACVSYGIWFVGDALYRKFRPKKKTLPKKPKRHLSAEQLLGECRHEVRQKQTNLSTYGQTEKVKEKPSTFAGSNEKQSPEPPTEEVSNEEFSKLEIPDVTLEYEPEPEENDNSNLGEEAEEIIPTVDGKVELAAGGGVNWEDWVKVLDVVVHTDATPSTTEQAKAGELLHQSEGNDIVEKLRSDPQRSMKIDELVCFHFEQLSRVRRTDENPFADTPRVVGDFDMNKYM